MTWRGDETPDELEILLGTLDESVLLGEYGVFLNSWNLYHRHRFRSDLLHRLEMLGCPASCTFIAACDSNKRRQADKCYIGKILTTPENGHFWCANMIKDVTDRVGLGKVGKMYKETSRCEILDS